jgi:hypothetical protein
MNSSKMTDSTNASDEADPMELALQFLYDYPTEKPATAARIYNVNCSTLRTIIQRRKAKTTRELVVNGGQNKILSEAQILAIYHYVRDSYYAGYGASKSMVRSAIAHLRAKEIPPKPEPSERWFQTFLKQHHKLFNVIKTKAIARVRVSAQDVEVVEDWFGIYMAWCYKHDIKAENIYNFDETGFRVGVAPGEEIIVPADVTEVYSLNSYSNSMNLLFFRCTLECPKIESLLQF